MAAGFPYARISHETADMTDDPIPRAFVVLDSDVMMYFGWAQRSVTTFYVRALSSAASDRGSG